MEVRLGISTYDKETKVACHSSLATSKNIEPSLPTGLNYAEPSFRDSPRSSRTKDFPVWLHFRGDEYQEANSSNQYPSDICVAN